MSEQLRLKAEALSEDIFKKMMQDLRKIAKDGKWNEIPDQLRKTADWIEDLLR